MWRQYLPKVNDSGAPKADFGAEPITKSTLTVPQGGGWREHVANIADNGVRVSQHVGDTLAAHLTDNPEHQRVISDAIRKFSLK